eukprot:jgi/Picsp_1/1526/NSC_05004-R1_trna a64-2 -o-ribosylphosphate transferase
MDADFDGFNKVINVVGAEGLVLCNHQPSITQVLRAVKRQEHSIFNCIASIVHDSEFVNDICTSREYCGYPVLGNLRCGAWYVPETEDTCYFKSTDGHSGHWSFSLTRLNFHVIELALSRGGVCIVDATRRGKCFPDALSKTIPIWAAVINTAVCLFREEHGLPHLPGEFLHLPKWVPEHECYQIESSIDIWASALLDSNADISCIARRMKVPLRCVWRGQNDAVDALPFGQDCIPLVLVSASLPEARHRRMLVIKDNDMVEKIMYDYIPGAGDDEESWSKGLKPAQLWKFYKPLLLSGKDGIDSVLQSIIKQECRNLYRNIKHKDKHSDQQEAVCWFGSTGLGLVHVEHIPMLMLSRSSQDVDVEEYGIVNLSRDDIAGVYSLRMSKTAQCREIMGGGMISKDCESFILDQDCTVTDYLWLPLHAGVEKLAVVKRSPAAIEFASMSLEKCKKVVFVYEDAASSSIAAALALGVLIACFKIIDSTVEITEQMKWQRCAKYSLDHQASCIRPACEKLSRNEFKRYVANSVAMYCPNIILRKDVLKQVFNCFVPRGLSNLSRIP